MSFFKKIISPFAEDLMIKLAKHQDFPDEKYELIVENKKLKSELKEFKSDKYAEIIEENKRLQMKVEFLQEEKIKALENEVYLLRMNSVLALESPHKNLPTLMDNSEVRERDLVKFVYISSIFKGVYFDGTSITKTITSEELEDMLETIFPILEFKVYESELIVYLYDKNKEYINHVNKKINSFIFIEEIEDWMKSSLNIKKEVKDVEVF